MTRIDTVTEDRYYIRHVGNANDALPRIIGYVRSDPTMRSNPVRFIDVIKLPLNRESCFGSRVTHPIYLAILGPARTGTVTFKQQQRIGSEYVRTTSFSRKQARSRISGSSGTYAQSCRPDRDDDDSTYWVNRSRTWGRRRRRPLGRISQVMYFLGALRLGPNIILPLNRLAPWQSARVPRYFGPFLTFLAL